MDVTIDENVHMRWPVYQAVGSLDRRVSQLRDPRIRFFDRTTILLRDIFEGCSWDCGEALSGEIDYDFTTAAQG